MDLDQQYRTTFNSWDKVAARYQEAFMDDVTYIDTYDRFCAAIPRQGADIFEIGCGPGNITRYLLSKRPDFAIKGIDVAPSMVAHASRNVPGAKFEVMDCKQLAAMNNRYDGIVCGFCIPYLAFSDCAQLFQDCFRLLHTGGSFYLSAIEGSYAWSGIETGSTGDSMYVYYYSESDLMQMLLEAGFTEITVDRISYDPKNHKSGSHLILLARKTDGLSS